MLIKINKKPITIEEEPEEKSNSWMYFTVSSIGYLLALWIMDLVSYTFFYIHPFPFLGFLTKFFLYLGGL